LDGVNKFVEYALDSLVPVPNQFYIGWVQTSADKMNLGFDRNRNNNDRIFYNVSTFFTQSSFEGSLMMRPVFANYKDPLLGIGDKMEIVDAYTLYPNPAHEFVRFDFGDSSPGKINVRISDAAGIVVLEKRLETDTRVSLHGLAAGFYHVTLFTSEGITSVKGLVISP